MQYSNKFGQEVLYANVLVEYPNNIFFYKKVKLSYTSDVATPITLGYCYDKVSNFNRISKISPGGNAGDPTKSPNPECDECRLNKRNLNPFMDWFNLLLHQNGTVGQYPLVNEYKWSGYNYLSPDPRETLNMPISVTSNIYCQGNPNIPSLTKIFHPETNTHENIPSCPSLLDFDCTITLNTIPEKFIKDVVTILSISRPPGKPYDYFEMIGQTIMGEKVTIYGNSPCMDICDKPCGGSGQSPCGVFEEFEFDTINDKYNTSFKHELDINGINGVKDDYPTISNNTLPIPNEYCLINNHNFVFRMMAGQTTFAKAFEYSTGKSFNANTKYKGTFTVLYREDATQPEIDAFMRIGGVIYSASKEKVIIDGYPNDFSITYTYYFNTGGTTGSVVLPVEIWMRNSSTYFNPPNGDGSQMFYLYKIGFEESCEPNLPCCPIPSPEFTVESPCSTLANFARENARTQYQAYVNRVRDEFKAAYIKKCLQAYEGFYMNQLDEKYHYTLYYYDQAGNLVRTIPPQGVKPLTQAQIDQVNLDRQNGTRTIFTEHDLATTYAYNSLNQLVEQTVPDNRDMDLILHQNLLNGIPSGLVIRGIQRISQSKAYLFADDNTTGNYSRIFTTLDGGQSWKENSDIGTRQLNKVQALSSTVQYAIGENGLFMKWDNTASSWQIKYVPSSASLSEIYFINDLNGTLFEETGMFYKTADGGETWTGPYTSLQKQFATGAKLSSVSAFYNLLYAATTGGEIYFSNNWGVIWEKQDKIRTKMELTTASFLDNNTAFIAGQGGLLLKGTASSNTKWLPINTGLKDKFLKLKFFTEQNGAALSSYVDLGNSYSKLIYSSNGGNGWSNAVPGAYTGNQRFVDMIFLSSSKGYALHESGSILMSINAGASWSLVAGTSPYTGTKKATSLALFVQGSSTFAFMASNEGDIYTANLNASTPTWSNVLGIYKPGNDAILQVHAISSSKVLFINSYGIAYTYAGGNSLVYLNTTYGIDKIWKADFDLGSANGTLLCQVASGDYTYYVSKYTNAGSPIVENASPPIYKTETGSHGFLYGNKNGNTTAFVGFTSGELFAKELDNCIDPTQCSWENVGQRITIGDISDIDYYKDSTVLSSSGLLVSSRTMAVGSNGKILAKNLNTPYWELLPFTNKINYTQVKIAPDIINIDPPADLVIAMGAGTKFTRINLERTGLASIQNYYRIDEDIYNSNAYTIYDIQYGKNYLGNNYLYACGMANTPSNKRCVLSGQAIGGIAFTEENIPTSNVPAYALAFKSISVFNTSSSTDYVLIGQEAKRVQKTSGVYTEQITRPNRVLATQMLTKTLGYAVGQNGKLYITNDAAQTWQLQASTNTISDNFSSVYFLSATIGYATGANGLYKTSDGITFTLLSWSNGIRFNKVHFNGNLGFVVGQNGSIYYSTDAGVNWTNLSHVNTQELYAVYTINSNLSISAGLPIAYAVGANGAICKICKNSSGILIADEQTYGTSTNWVSYLKGSSSVLRDVYFRDYQTGYIIGDNGVLLKTITGGNSGLNSSTWTSITTPSPSANFTTLYSGDGKNLWIGGNNSVVKEVYDRSDELSSRFYYDAVGRLVVSQNAKQYYEASSGQNVYSYTLYDAQGRIYEVGQITSATKVESLYAGAMMNQNLFIAWVTSSSNTRSQVTKTYYDEMAFTSTPLGIPSYLRKRVSSTAYYPVFTGDIFAYQSAIHYSYDIHGNVNRMLNDNPSLELVGARYKETAYEYDVLTGKVIQVNYQKNQSDQFAHHYEYDNLNRLTGVYTSNKTNLFTGEQYHSLWQKDARYSYYLHGPLARTELGNDQVQGLDYAYTLQGWLKGVNSATLLPQRDMGKDGCANCTITTNANFAKDEMGFILGYNQNDYDAILPPSTSEQFTLGMYDASASAPGSISSEIKNLYNGNISSMTTAIGKFMEGVNPVPNTMVYGYDQLNRLVSTKRYTNVDMSANYWKATTQSNTDYNENYTYDANGNILTLNRNGIDYLGKNQMDKLSYSYERFTHNQKKNTNKLLSVADAENTYALAGYEDIKPGQSYVSNTLAGNNYSYDAIGNLVQDQQEEIEQIIWNVYCKIAEITRTPESNKAGLAFLYNPSGQRICKIVKPAGAGPEAWHYTYYMLDAQGNTLSTYSLLGNAIQQERVLLYGSSRLGELSTLPSQLGACNIGISDEDLLNNRSIAISGLLNNVFASSNNAGFTQQAIDFWTIKWSNYFSNQINQMAPEVNTLSTHQFLWNAWANWLCGLRCYTNLDANVFSIWENEWTSRTTPFTNQEIACSKEMCPEVYENLLPLWHLNEQNQQVALNGMGYISNCNQQLNFVKGTRHYELSNHLGNVLSVVSDRKIEVDESYTYQSSGGYIFQNGAYSADPSGNYVQTSPANGLIDGFVAEVISATDYYAFGAPMPGRSYQASEYRFGFNGQERDDEVSGTGNTMSAEFWEYDSRLGRRFNRDPKPNPSQSEYSCFANNPILLNDIKGDTVRISLFGKKDPQGFHLLSKKYIKDWKNDGVFIVFSHGDPDGLEKGNMGNNGEKQSRQPEEVLEMIFKRSPTFKDAYKSGKKVTLILMSCNTGNDLAGGTVPIAQKIANLSYNLTVIAPNGFIKVGDKGQFFGIIPESGDKGHFVTFQKQQPDKQELINWYKDEKPIKVPMQIPE
ncbi:MAG: hypothetical protein CFE21_20710 [Bacteroidetes bacterium B1(2017)]|nr:MAG: hypothetical protein CFE21_20710 [Bacteroidetes bacterium B1(2017)]